MLPFFCSVLWTPTKRAMPDTSVMRPISAAGHLEQREASYACVVLVDSFLIGSGSDLRVSDFPQTFWFMQSCIRSLCSVHPLFHCHRILMVYIATCVCILLRCYGATEMFFTSRLVQPHCILPASVGIFQL